MKINRKEYPIRAMKGTKGTTYRAVLSVNGRQHQRTFKTKAEAAGWVDVERGKVASGGSVQRTTTLTIDQALDAWLEGLGGRPVTVSGYRNAARPVRENLGAVKVAELKPTRVVAFIRWAESSGSVGGKPLSPRTIRYAMLALRGCLDRLVADDVLAKNPATHQVVTKRMKQLKSRSVRNRLDDAPWTPEDRGTFTESVQGHEYELAFRLALIGLRRSELCGLRWDAVDFAAPSLKVCRTRVLVNGQYVDDRPDVKHDATSRRTLDLGELGQLVALLKAERKRQVQLALSAGSPWRDDRRHVVVDAKGQPPRPDRVSDEWAAAVKSAGVSKIGLHDARHLAGSTMLASGMPPAAVAKWLGHTVPVLLSTYIHDDGVVNPSAALG